jgi:hypothetical protein
MSGIDLAIQVKDGGYIPKILLMSGNPVTSDLLESAHQRGYEFEILPKPMNSGELLERVFVKCSESER